MKLMFVKYLVDSITHNVPQVWLKALKALGLYNAMCRTFLPKRKFIIEPFVYIDKYGGIARGEITDKVRWLEKFETKAHSIEDAELEFWQEARVKYGFCDDIWLF